MKAPSNAAAEAIQRPGILISITTRPKQCNVALMIALAPGAPATRIHAERKLGMFVQPMTESLA